MLKPTFSFFVCSVILVQFSAGNSKTFRSCFRSSSDVATAHRQLCTSSVTTFDVACSSSGKLCSHLSSSHRWFMSVRHRQLWSHVFNCQRQLRIPTFTRCRTIVESSVFLIFHRIYVVSMPFNVSSGVLSSSVIDSSSLYLSRKHTHTQFLVHIQQCWIQSSFRIVVFVSTKLLTESFRNDNNSNWSCTFASHIQTPSSALLHQACSQHLLGHIHVFSRQSTIAIIFIRC